MKIITVEEHFMVKEVNDRFNEVIKPKDKFDENQLRFVSMFVNRGQITDIGEQRIAFMDENGITTQVIGYGNNRPILSGKGKAICDREEEELYQGVMHICPKGSEHTIINTSDDDLTMLTIVAAK